MRTTANWRPSSYSPAEWNKLSKVEKDVLREAYKDSQKVLHRDDGAPEGAEAVEVSADLRNATVAYSVIGEESVARDAVHFFKKHAGEIRKVVSKHVILKYSPKLHFVRDYGIERGNRVMEILDEIQNEGKDSS